jgi:hypothetical protein
LNSNGSSAFSAVWSYTTGPVPTPLLSSPLNNATGVAINNTVLTWAAVSSATSYYIEYATNAAFTGATGTTVVLNTYTLPTLLNNQTYYWHVYANYNAFSSVYSSSHFFTTEAAAILQAPQLSSPANMATAIPIVGTSLIWQNVIDALSYDWEISTNPTFTTVVSGNTINTKALLSSLIDNTTYYWHVRSVDADTVSAWSSTFTFTTDVLSGLNNQFNENGAVYFNNEQLNIKLNKNLIGATCQIINAAGQTIYEEILWDLNSQIFASQWSKGIYFVRLVQHEKQQSFKIVVQ